MATNSIFPGSSAPSSIRASDGFVGTFGAALASHAAREAPQVRLRFAHQDKEDVEALREGPRRRRYRRPSARWDRKFDYRRCSTTASCGVVRPGHPLA